MKRQRSEDAIEDGAGENARSRKKESTQLLPQLPAGFAERVNEDMMVSVIKEVTGVLERNPFGLWPKECRWNIKRELFDLLPRIIAPLEKMQEIISEKGTGSDLSAADVEAEALSMKRVVREYMVMMDQLLRSGYAQSVLDRRKLVDMRSFRPGMCILRISQEDVKQLDSPEDGRLKAMQVGLYVYLAEHVASYEDWSSQKRDFWEPSDFMCILHEMPNVFVNIPEDIDADQWEMYSADLEGPLRTLVSFLIPHSDPLTVTSPIDSVMLFLDEMVQKLDHFDRLFGNQISAKARGAPLEELIRLSGVLFMRVMATFEEQARVKDVGRWAVSLLKLLVKLLMLEVPTCIKSDTMRDGRGDMPSDERQQDNEWIEGLWEHIEHMASESRNKFGLDPKEPVGRLLDRMVHMSLEEQRYRLECVAPLIPSFINEYAERLKDKSVPPELSSLKTVINTVMQDGVAMGSELLEEISFYPCLLEFATKRALIHGLCERTKLQGSANDPIRLVVPRDNVLDGVCNTLNLQDSSARIDVPLEIEFRAGYADSTGNELADEGEDQGGLRRQWLDRASRYFITSDLFVSPSEDAAHLEAACGISSNRRARGLIFVPSAESVCSCVQDDWKEQFELFGCVLGFAILYKETIPVHFGHAFLRSVFGLKTNTEDLLPLLENIDKTLHTKLKYILGGSYQELGDTLQDVLEQSHLPLNFTLSESHCPELVKNAPLKENGDNILVSEENKDEFVTLLLERVLIKGVACQVDCFRRGLHRVVPEELVQRVAELMTVKEIELMVCGADEVDVNDWEKHTNYENGYNPDSQPVRWFWEVVRRMSEQQRAALLSFATGSSQVPSGGFRFLQPELFTIQRVAVTDRYPEAHTCANMVDLPEYTSLEELERRLLFAVEEAGDAFGRR